MTSKMPLLHKLRPALPQPSGAIHCGRVIISLHVCEKNQIGVDELLSECETTEAQGGTGTHFQFLFTARRRWPRGSALKTRCISTKLFDLLLTGAVPFLPPFFKKQDNHRFLFLQTVNIPGTITSFRKSRWALLLPLKGWNDHAERLCGL